MPGQISKRIISSASIIIFWTSLFLPQVAASDTQRSLRVTLHEFWPTNREAFSRRGIGRHATTPQITGAFRHLLSALPRVGVAFNYTGHGINGGEAYGRINHDRSFDAHISILDEKTYVPAISLGLRDFIGTGWYSSEYIVSTKSVGNLELTAGLGFGRLAGRHTFSNPLGTLSSKFENRQSSRKSGDRGGTLGNINWFQGDAAAFYGIQYRISDKIKLSSEYTPDMMKLESSYFNAESPWNFGASYQQ